MSTYLKRHWRDHWHWAALVALMLVVFADPLFTGRVFFYRDLGNLMHPVIGSAMALAGEIDGGIPWAFWTHLVSNGRPMLANPGYALLAPASQLFWFSFDSAFNLFLIGHVLIGSLGMALLARRLGARPVAAFAAGAAYGLGGGMISALALYWTTVAAAWAPWVLAAGHAALERLTLRRVALLALALGLQALGGQPEPILATLVVGAALSLAVSNGSAMRRVGQVALTWGIAGLWGIAIAAPQLIPAALHARTTLRSLGFTTQGLLSNSLDPRALPGLFLPQWGGSPMDRLSGGFPGGAWTDSGTPYLVSHYLGLVAVVLAIVGIVALVRQGRRGLALALGASALLGIAIALGRHVPGVEALLDSLSLHSPLRYPVKALYVTFLAIPPLVAMGVEAIASTAASSAHRRASLVAALLALLVVLDLTASHRGFTPTIDQSALAEPPLSRQLKARARALGAGDNEWRIHHERLPGGSWGETSPELSATEQAQYLWRRRVLLPPIGAAFGIHHAMEPSGDLLDDIAYFEMSRRAYQSPRDEWARALGRAGVLFVLSPNADLETQSGGVLRVEKTLGAGELVPAGSVHLYRNEAWRPRAFLASGRVTSVKESHFGLSLTLRADRAGELLISDALGDLPAWSASIDGAPATLRRAEGAFVALDVPEGGHAVELRYRPRGFFASLTAALAAFLAVLVAIGHLGRSARVRTS